MPSAKPNDPANAPRGTISMERAAEATLVIRLLGQWHLQRNLPSATEVVRELSRKPALRRVAFDSAGLFSWDSGLVSFVANVSEFCGAHGITDDRGGLPAGVQRLLELAEAVPEKQGARTKPPRAGIFTRIGDVVIGYGLSAGEALEFVGDLAIASGQLLSGAARFRRIDLMQNLQDCGPSAVGIVTLISFLVGVILAFMGAVQLQQFGASIYVADLVAIGMLREMGAMMTAIIMSGRTGAAFAAQLGTMKVTQEIDALSTMGISPFQFLVLPRIIALVLMMPLLCLYSDLMGILGGAFVGVTMLDISFISYVRETIGAISLDNLFLGVAKATVYGGLIAIAGCLRGFQCGSSSSAVGDAATQAVVTSIVMVVIACGIFAFVSSLIGI
ncbi:MAG TPA: ABC transporter permease [Candidatus Binataceae bacterium]|nr:ABC transporter permease [Candidatus Binataceae bacterium]